MIQSQNTIDAETALKPVNIYTEKDIRKMQAELLKKIIKIHADSYSRGGFRVVIHNLIAELEGAPERRA